jgi:diamine N-acetyltransferase
LPGRGFSCSELIDLFDQKTIGQVGIVIQGLDNRKQNIGSEALGLLIQYSFNNLIYINCMQILAPKMKQVKLFLLNFECIGIKKIGIL